MIRRVDVWASNAHMIDMSRVRKNQRQGTPFMTTATVKFSQKDFNRGVNDALTFAPLRAAVHTAAAAAFKGGASVKRSDANKAGKTLMATHARNNSSDR